MRWSAFTSAAGWASLAVPVLLSIAAAFPAPAKGQPEAAPGAIAPYLDDTTIAVARLDLDRIDSDTTAMWVAKFLQAIESVPTDSGKVSGDPSKLVPHIRQWTADFVRAGGKTVYVVVRLNGAAPAYAFVPLATGADPKVLGEMLKDPFAGSLVGIPAAAGTAATSQSAGDPPLGSMKSEVIGTALYFGPADTLTDLHHFAPAARPELEKALAEAGDAPVRVAFNPSEGLRQMLASTKDLPKEFGGGPVTPVSSGLRWASLALDAASPSENPSLSLTIQASDAAAAKALSGIVDAIRQSAAKEGGPGSAEANGFLSVVAPKATSEHPDQLRVRLDVAKTREALNMLADSIQAGRVAALQIQSMTNIRRVCMGVMAYAADHNRIFPKDLQTDLKPYLGKDPNAFRHLFTNPRQPARKANGYVYIRPANKITDLKDPGETPMVYEAFDEWGRGINVGYADGHVELIRSQVEFNKILKNNPNLANGAAFP